MHSIAQAKLIRITAVVGLLISSITCDGFEVATHAAITHAGWARTNTEMPGLIRKLGFLTQAADPLPSLGDRYFDVFQGDIQIRRKQAFELKMLEEPNPKGLALADQSSRVNGWLMIGAIREDDNPSEGNPKDDPYAFRGAFHREFNHFFDPIWDRPLTVAGLQVVYGTTEPIRKAVDWGLGTADAFVDANTRDPSTTRNHFTIFDARESLFRALTLRRRTQFSGYEDVPNIQTPAQAENTRLAYWATTFRALGDILHLNQDMAQPQHTRNESHSGTMVVEYLGGGHASLFEKYLDDRARQVAPKLPNGTSGAPPPPLPFDGYPTVSFEKFSDFWSTEQGVGSAVRGKGLANYSNAGFFTPAENYPTSRYPSPGVGEYPSESATGLLPTHADVSVKFLRGGVEDHYAGNVSNIRLTTESLWTDRLDLDGRPFKAWSLNRFNYDDMASLLIPRAVAYSSGILQHFFRGEMEISLPDAGFFGIVDHAKFVPSRSGTPTDPYVGFKGFDKIKVKLKNTTPRLALPDGSYVDQPMSSGSVVAVLKFHRNTCYDDLLTRWPTSISDARSCRSPIEEIVASDHVVDTSVPVATASAPMGTEFTFHFPERQLPINAWDVVLQVVYRGQLGSEADAIAVGTKDIAEPMFAGFMNTTDYVVINGRFYRPAEVAANQALFASVLPACRSGQPGGYIVSPACYNITDAFTFTAGNPRPVMISAANDSAIGPRRLARIALLTERHLRPALEWDPTAVNCWVFLSRPLTLEPYLAEQDPDEGWTFGLPLAARSVRSWQMNLCYADIALQPTTPDLLDFTQLDDLVGQEIEPTPLTISGWN